MELWKYYTLSQHKEYLSSLHLLGKQGYSQKEELKILYSLSKYPEKNYRQGKIAKKNGGVRELVIPNPLLKIVQKNILSNILETSKVSRYATAYQKGMGIRENALPHVGQQKLLKMDIVDFFSTINFSMIYRLAFPRIYFPPAVATLFTSLCCYKDGLPQGAPTSAFISNLVMKPFDEHMGEWCEKRNIIYTRYSDDMTFSGNFDEILVINKVTSFLEILGFRAHTGKTKLLNNSSCQLVTGQVVNEKLQVPRGYRKQLRQEVYYTKKYGVESHLRRLNSEEYDWDNPHDIEKYLLSLLGKMAFVLQINPADREAPKDRQTVLEIYHEVLENAQV